MEETMFRFLRSYQNDHFLGMIRRFNLWTGLWFAGYAKFSCSKIDKLQSRWWSRTFPFAFLALPAWWPFLITLYLDLDSQLDTNWPREKSWSEVYLYSSFSANVAAIAFNGTNHGKLCKNCSIAVFRHITKFISPIYIEVANSNKPTIARMSFG